ncbi:MAG TPA: PfkB family carbohydrate kinase, partial [Candidatus Deferrimicrobium sp.]|nr:PfkB family carbohydrate kinase [Candidatus Deferrimicrobium sp.]
MKKVLGIGNAVVDVLIGLEEDDFIAGFGLAKGSMTLVDQDTMNNILNKAASAKMEMRRSSGGSVANAIHGMSQLGAPVGYIGKTGADEYGAFFRSYMEQNNISATLFQGKQATGKSMVMVSKDSERTMATYLGAAIELDAADLTIEPFKGYDYF